MSKYFGKPCFGIVKSVIFWKTRFSDSGISFGLVYTIYGCYLQGLSKQSSQSFKSVSCKMQGISFLKKWGKFCVFPTIRPISNSNFSEHLMISRIGIYIPSVRSSSIEFCKRIIKWHSGKMKKRKSLNCIFRQVLRVPECWTKFSTEVPFIF